MQSPTLARTCDLITSDPECHTGDLRAGTHSFLLPLSTPQFTVSLFRHPRSHAAPPHRSLRGFVLEIHTAIR
jgi:hypothetical protein